MALPSASSLFSFMIPIWRDWKLLLPSLGPQTVLPTENSNAENGQSGNKCLQSLLNAESRTALGSEVLLFLSVTPPVLKLPPHAFSELSLRQGFCSARHQIHRMHFSGGPGLSWSSDPDPSPKTPRLLGCFSGY